jgi:hypothetical protein
VLELADGSSGNVVNLYGPNSTMSATYNLFMPVAQAAGSGYTLSNDGSGVLSWVSPATLIGGDYIKNQYTSQSSAGFNITGSTNTNEAQIATTYTAGSATALSLTSNNTNGGHANYGLAFSVGGGATNFDIIGTSSSWSVTNAGVLTLGSALTVPNGGTGAATLTGILFGNGTSAITGSHAVALASEVTGTLPTANGGTGLSSPTANAVLLTNGSSALQTIAPSTSGNVLTSNGTTWASTRLRLLYCRANCYDQRHKYYFDRWHCNSKHDSSHEHAGAMVATSQGGWVDVDEWQHHE